MDQQASSFQERPDTAIFSVTTDFTQLAHTLDASDHAISTLAIELNKVADTVKIWGDQILTLQSEGLTDPQVYNVLNTATFDHIQGMVISPVVDEIILLAVKKEMDPLLLELTTLKHSISAPGSSFTGHAIPIRTAFAQAETKEFNISKFIQEMERIHLTENDLMALEHFWDSILRAFNTICTSSQLYPFYKDLKRILTSRLPFAMIPALLLLVFSRLR